MPISPLAVLVLEFVVAFGAQDPKPVPSAPSAPSAMERAEAFARKGQNDAAMDVLRAAIEVAPLREKNGVLARFLAWLGRSDEALELLRKGIGAGAPDDDIALQWRIGGLHRQLGDEGPFFRHEGGMVAYLPKDDKVDEKAWRSAHYTKALDAYVVVLKRRPDHERAYEIVGELQQTLEMHDAALATWSEAEQRFANSSSAALGRAKALTALGRVSDAVVACEKAVRLAPRLAEPHAMLATHLESTGKVDEAAKERLQASFCEWAPEFLELDFATAGASFPKLEPRFDAEPSREQRAVAVKARSEEIERLLTTRDAVSSRLLALLCYHHGDHGETETRIFAELEARGAESIPVLRALLENAQTTCTQKGCALALARLRAPGILETLLEMLPGDVRPLYDADIAGALAALGDRAAIPALIETARLDAKDAAEASAGGEHMDRQGLEYAQLRAVFALGALGGDDAKAALEKGLGRETVGTGCLIALFHISRDEKLVDKVRAAVLAENSYAQLLMTRHLESFAPALAKELRDLKEAKDKEPETSSAERDKKDENGRKK